VLRMINGPLADRALLGSDFPLISRVRIMKELKELPIREEPLRKLISDNPRKILGLG
jgi:predicted TIM-barrel fold metal-dependent hydrolase